MDLVAVFQDLVGQVPDILQPLIVAAAGAIPFIEGEGAASIGVLGGINPVVAAIAAIVGNFACVSLLVLLSAGARQAVVTRSRGRARASVSSGGSTAHADDSVSNDQEMASGHDSPRKLKFQRALERYGVPGVSLLGPLLLPTHFTATMLAATGVSKTRVLLWQGIAIVGWTTAFTILISGVLTAVR